MISTRGPHQIMVLERSAVPIHEIIGAMCHHETLDDIKLRYPVDNNEIWVCAEIFADQLGPTDRDFVAMNVFLDDQGEQHVETVNISDWVFVSCAVMGADESDSENIHELYAVGVEMVVMDCIDDIINGNENFREVPLHSIVWDAFEVAWNDLKPGAIDEMIEKVRVNLQDEQNQDE